MIEVVMYDSSIKSLKTSSYFTYSTSNYLLTTEAAQEEKEKIQVRCPLLKFPFKGKKRQQNCHSPRPNDLTILFIALPFFGC